MGPPPNQEQKAPYQHFGPQASPYLTKEDIDVILIEARKVESFVYIDIRPPYPKEMAIKPCPTTTRLLFFPNLKV